MGNRAVVTFANRDEMSPFVKPDGSIAGFCKHNQFKVGVYLHWNGGMDSIIPFCRACKILGVRGPVSDCYGVACFVQMARNFFDSSDGFKGNSVGVDALAHLDCNNGDNGVYIVDDDWNIIGREYSREEQLGTEDDYNRMTTHLCEIMRNRYNNNNNKE